jgi:hypothetical protein
MQLRLFNHPSDLFGQVPCAEFCLGLKTRQPAPSLTHLPELFPDDALPQNYTEQQVVIPDGDDQVLRGTQTFPGAGGP